MCQRKGCKTFLLFTLNFNQRFASLATYKEINIIALGLILSNLGYIYIYIYTSFWWRLIFILSIDMICSETYAITGIATLSYLHSYLYLPKYYMTKSHLLWKLSIVVFSFSSVAFFYLFVFYTWPHVKQWKHTP